MSQGFIGLISSNIAVVISIFSVATALISPSSKIVRLWIVGAVAVLAIMAIMSSFYNESMIETQQKKVNQRRIELQDKIGSLLERGEEISNTLKISPIVGLKEKEQDVASWERKTEDLLRLEFGKAYVIRFESCAGLIGQALPAPNNVPDPMWTEQSNYWWTMNCRIYNLEKFSAQIPAAS